MEEYIKGIADSGALVVVSGSSVGEMALHFCEKYGLMVVKMPSKFELARICRATGATARATFGAPSADELGFAKSLSVQVRCKGCGEEAGDCEHKGNETAMCLQPMVLDIYIP